MRLYKAQELLNEVGYLNKAELKKPHGKSGIARAEILRQAIEAGGHEKPDGSIAGVELVDGQKVFPVPPSRSPQNAEIIKVLKASEQDPEALQQLYPKGDEALKFHAWPEDDDNAYFYRVADIKKSGYFGGGRAAGKSDADLTAAQEGIQAMALAYAATGKKLTGDDINEQTLSGASKNFSLQSNYNPESVQEIYNSKQWKDSIASTANVLASKLNLSGKVIHHGSSWVDGMMKVFNKANHDLNGRGKEFRHKDKWNPADIWAVDPSVQVPQGINDLAELKAQLQDWYEKGLVYPISLKKIGKTPTVKTFNFDDDIDDILNLEIERLVVSNKNNQIFSNKGTTIFYEMFTQPSFLERVLKEGTVETRTFQSGEVDVTSELKDKGAKAAGGKIGFSLLNKILADVGLPTLTPKGEIGQLINKRAKNKMSRYKAVLDTIIDNATAVNPAVAEVARTGLANVIDKKEWPFIVSKFQAVELLKILKTSGDKEKSKDFLQRLVRYASSRSELSSVFVKVW